MNKPLIVITDNLIPHNNEEKAVLSPLRADLRVLDSSVPREERLSLCRRADALLVNMTEIDRGFIDSLEKCKIISRYGVGYDNVDVERATARGIWVGTVPDYCYQEVAEHTTALLLALSRDILSRDRAVRAGQWRVKPLKKLAPLRGSTLGILGYGRTGHAFHHQIRGFGFGEVLIHSSNLDEGDEIGGAKVVSFEELVARTDYLSLHIPLDETTRHLFDRKTLFTMKNGARLINTARGAIVDEEALYEALASGHLGGAAVDVLEEEPPRPDNPLLQLDNMVFTDHEAYYSENSIASLKRKTAENVLACLSDGKPIFAVNEPKA
ncbi:MAG: C-terminal binding protein [Spirochaetales bacterium]|nr:C-terminal binding protein [Spirochaetales bacterium]